MNAYNRYKNRLERFLQTERGKRFINFAYSIGAAIVILGAMFKLLHFPFGNEMLFIGMMTEVVVFTFSAFDRPVQDYAWEQVFPALTDSFPEGRDDRSKTSLHQAAPSPQSEREATREPRYRTHPVNTTRVAQPHDTSRPVFGNTVSSFPEEHQATFVSHLATGTEEYSRQMENLNRTLSGLNSIYEIQLKGISSQIGAIEQINQGLNRLRDVYGDTLPDGASIKKETEKMADQLKELNEVYGRMLHAMTVDRGNNPDNPRS